MRCPAPRVGLAAGSYVWRAGLPAWVGAEPSSVYHVDATAPTPVSFALSVTVTGAPRQPSGTLSVVAGAVWSTLAAVSFVASRLFMRSTEKYRMRWPGPSRGLLAGSYGRRARFVATAGSEPSVVYHVVATPEPAPSSVLSVTVTSA